MTFSIHTARVVVTSKIREYFLGYYKFFVLCYYVVKKKLKTKTKLKQALVPYVNLKFTTYFNMISKDGFLSSCAHSGKDLSEPFAAYSQKKSLFNFIFNLDVVRLLQCVNMYMPKIYKPVEGVLKRSEMRYQSLSDRATATVQKYGTGKYTILRNFTANFAVNVRCNG